MTFKNLPARTDGSMALFGPAPTTPPCARGKQFLRNALDCAAFVGYIGIVMRNFAVLGLALAYDLPTGGAT